MGWGVFGSGGEFGAATEVGDEKAGSWSIFPVENKQPACKAGYCWGSLPVTTRHRRGTQIPAQL